MTFIKGGVFELGYIQCDTTYVFRGNPKVNINNIGGDPSGLGLALKGKTTQKTTTCCTMNWQWLYKICSMSHYHIELTFNNNSIIHY